MLTIYMFMIVWWKFLIKNLKKLIFGIIIYFLAALFQITAIVIHQMGIISSDSRVVFLFLSIVIASIADIIIIKSISNKIIQTILFIHAAVALIGSVIFFTVSVIKLLWMVNQSGFRTNRPWQLFTRWQSPELFNRQHFPYIKSKFSQWVCLRLTMRACLC